MKVLLLSYFILLCDSRGPRDVAYIEHVPI